MTKEVPKTAVSAIPSMFAHVSKTCRSSDKQRPDRTKHNPNDFDWAIHPGGAAILQGAQQTLDLTDDHIRASLETYHSCGNSSSPTVLIVLDRLRSMGQGRDNVVATSFGPGMTIEMCMMTRCRDGDIAPRSRLAVGRKHNPWLLLQSRLAKLLRWPSIAD
jgi:3-oxoacyl-[acyl-carrier-protein] synthase III